MKKLSLFFLPLIMAPFLMTSCAGFLNEKFDMENQLAECFKAKIDGIEILYPDPDSEQIKIESQVSETEIILTATDGFESYSWTVDGEIFGGNANSITIVKDSLEGGFYLITVVATDSDGNCFSASIYIKVNGEKTFTGTTITSGFENADSASLVLTAVEDGDIIQLTATSGFVEYAWFLDGNAIVGSTETQRVNTASLSFGYHLVSVTAKSGDLYYSTSINIEKNE